MLVTSLNWNNICFIYTNIIQMCKYISHTVHIIIFVFYTNLKMLN